MRTLKLSLTILVLMIAFHIGAENKISQPLLMADSCCESSGTHDHHEFKIADNRKEKNVETSAEIIKALQSVYVSYFALQHDLAVDKQENVSADFKRIIEAIGQNEQENEVWSELSAKIKDTSTLGAKSQNLEKSRLVFKELSLEVLELLERFNHANGKPIRKISCSMAFNNQGAYWFQPAGEDIANPYMGKAMSKCGNVVKTYAGVN